MSTARQRACSTTSGRTMWAVSTAAGEAARSRVARRAARLAQLTPLPCHLAQDRGDDVQRGELGRTPRAREVVEAELDHHRPRLARPQQQLGVDEAALALQLDPLEQRAAEELEGEVHVADAEA